MNTSKKKQADALKKAMRQLPFPVVIATAAVGIEKRGVTIGSFTSLSLSPPLISFNINHASQIYLLIKRATHFAIRLPEPEQTSLCDHFAQSGLSSSEQFKAINHYRNAYGSPILKDIGTVIQCRTYDKIPAGDHTIFVGEVVEVDQPNDKAGLLYYDRTYRSVGTIIPEKKTGIKRAG